MSDTRWKAFERRCAVLLGTRRIPVTGERAGADAETSLFCFQFKKRSVVPGYIRQWLDGIRCAAAARSPQKVGVVVMQLPRRQDLDALVVMSLKDFIDLHGPVRPTPDNHPVHVDEVHPWPSTPVQP